MTALRPIVCRPFIGRRAELEFLHQRRRETASSRGGIVLIAGEAGVGKTRLINEFRRTLTKSRVKVGMGQCLEFAQRPYGPLLDVLAQLEPPAPRLEAAASKREHFDSIAAAFVRIAARTAVVAVVEDVHWSDSATLELLAYLSTKLAALRVLVVASYRRDELHFEHPVLGAIRNLESGPAVGQICLAPLSGREMRTFIDEALLGIELPNEMRRAVARASEGNPFFIEELLKSAVERGTGQRELPQELPFTLSAAVWDRVRALDRAERRVVGQAAVIGRIFDVELLAETLHTTADAVRPTLEHARSLQLLVDDTTNTFRFRHALTREAIYSGFLAAQLRPLHREIAAALERLPAGRRSMEGLAYHWEAAGDASRTARYAELAGDDAGAVYAHDDAIAQYTRALRYTDADSADAARLYSKAGAHYRLNGAYAAARNAYRHAAAIYRPLERLEDEIECHSVIARCNLLLGEPEPASEAELLLAKTPPTARYFRSLLHLLIAEMSFASWQPAATKHHLDAVELDLFSGRPRLLFAYHNAQVACASFEGDVPGVRAAVHCAVEAADHITPAGGESADAETSAGLYLALAGRPREGLQHLQRGVRIARERHVRSVESRAHAVSAYAHLLLGDLAAVRRALDAVERTPIDNVMVTAHAAAWGTLAALHLGDEALLSRWVDDVPADLGEIGVRFYAAGHAEVLYRRGRFAEAEALLRSALAPGRSQRGSFMTLLAIARFGTADDIAPARRMLAHEAAAQDVPEVAALALFDAYAAQREGRREQIGEPARRAAEGFARFEYPLWEAAALELAGEVQAAQAIYERCGALGDLRRLENGENHGTVLSAREHAIAVLVASGCSNAEIGSQLAISHKTVEKHLGTMYQRFGLSSRSQLAALVSRPDRSPAR